MPSAPARFGWGLDGETTTITEGRVTHYFRRWFNVNDPALLTGLVFQLQRDDGAVVYLNGEEIFRSNLPAGVIGHDTAPLTALTAAGPRRPAAGERALSGGAIGAGAGAATSAITGGSLPGSSGDQDPDVVEHRLHALSDRLGGYRPRVLGEHRGAEREAQRCEAQAEAERGLAVPRGEGGRARGADA